MNSEFAEEIVATIGKTATRRAVGEIMNRLFKSSASQSGNDPSHITAPDEHYRIKIPPELRSDEFSDFDRP